MSTFLRPPGWASHRARRIFLVKASTAITSPDFSITGLASAGRMDVVARAMIAALSLRSGVRKDVLFCAVLEGPPKPPVTIELRGWELERMPLSEAEVGLLIQKLLRGETVGGAAVRRIGFKEVVLGLLEHLGVSCVVYLHERGIDVASLELGERLAMILGDHKGVDPTTEGWLKSLGVKWVSLGPTPYFTEHCITYMNYLIDGGVARA